jgi:hypothetical protein
MEDFNCNNYVYLGAFESKVVRGRYLFGRCYFIVAKIEGI